MHGWGISICLSICLSAFPAWGKDAATGFEASLINQYLTSSLKVADPSAFNLSLRLQRRLEKICGDCKDEGVRERIYTEVFSPQSAQTLAYVFDSFQSTEYNNGIVLGLAGVGKSFLLDQLTLQYSFGLMPDYLKEALALTDAELEDPQSIPSTFFGNTDVVLITHHLLSHAPESRGQPWATQDVRMKGVLTELFAEAKKEFKRTDASGARVGRRTIFVIDEIATLPPLVNETLKTILDESGFHDQHQARIRGGDPGYMVLALTTPGEYRRMVGGDSAVERRYSKIVQPEPTDEQSFQIVRKKATDEWEGLYNKLIVDEAIRFIIHNRKFLTSPPLAAPASVLRATNAIFLWKRRHPGQDPDVISLRDAQEFLMKRAGLTDLWFEGPNGEPPFYNLEERIYERFSDNKDVVRRIANRIKTWARLGMSDEVPVFLLGGPTGSGKDTLIAAINYALFGHDGKKFNFSIAGERGYGIDAIISGPPLGNHSDQEQGMLVRALDEGYGNGIIALNEAFDTPSSEFDKLKVLLESGLIRPKGLDSRERHIRFPIFIVGQFGERLFEDKSDDEIAAMMRSLSQADIDRCFTEGKENKKYGAVSRAVLERAKHTGGVILLAPVSRVHYPHMIGTWWGGIKARAKRSNMIDLDIDNSSMNELLTAIATYEGLGARAMDGLAVDFTEGAISEAQDHGLPRREVKLQVSVVGGGSPYERDILLTWLERDGGIKKQWKFKPAELSRFRLGCGDQIVNEVSFRATP